MARPMRGAYFDPNTNIRYNTNDADFEGWLTKQSSWLKEWRKRYFILKGSKLFFSKVGPLHMLWSGGFRVWAKENSPDSLLLEGGVSVRDSQHQCQNEYLAPHGMIDLSQCMTVKSAELKAQKRNALEVSTPDTTFLMYADTEKEKDDWIGAIGRAIVRSSTTYTQEHNDDDDDDDDDSS